MPAEIGTVAMVTVGAPNLLVSGSNPRPIHRIQHQRFTEQKGWHLKDISLSSAGHFAISGGNYNTGQTFIDLYFIKSFDSSALIKLLWTKEFSKYANDWERLVSILNDFDEMVTSVVDELAIVNTNEGKSLGSCKVSGTVTCLAVNGGDIFIGFLRSTEVKVYGRDLRQQRTINLDDIGAGDSLWDMAVTSEGLFVRSFRGKALLFGENDGKLRHTVRDSKHSPACSVGSCLRDNTLCVLYNWNKIVIYSLSEYKCVSIVRVEKDVDVVRLLNGDGIVTGNWKNGEIQIYTLLRQKLVKAPTM
ncbi:hypothetical protein HOLleu_21125 [Holothuria leucospilota]|uniref:Uncharacterized protein n=1 Tax=Holothuria leucospilota TaxID=206669 RepID=A0A9Q1BW01_HOLLE|nr:hypothetical protein HOLleu_21125 [Holothuria leucospilota]